MVGKIVVKEVVSRFLCGEGDEREVFLYFRFGEGENFHLMSITIGVTHENLEYIDGHIVAECFAFEM